MDSLTTNLNSLHIIDSETGTSDSRVRSLTQPPISTTAVRRLDKKPKYDRATTFSRFPLLPSELQALIIRFATNNIDQVPEKGILRLNYDGEGDIACESLSRLDKKALKWGYNPLTLVNSFFRAEVAFAQELQWPDGLWGNGAELPPGTITEGLDFTAIDFRSKSMVLEMSVSTPACLDECIDDLPAALRLGIEILHLSDLQTTAWQLSFADARNCLKRHESPISDFHAVENCLWIVFPALKVLVCTTRDKTKFWTQKRDQDEGRELYPGWRENWHEYLWGSQHRAIGS